MTFDINDLSAQPEGSQLTIFKEAIDNLPVSIFIKNASGTYVFINKQFEKEFNILKSQAIGKNDNEVFLKDIADSLIVNDRKVVESDKQISFEEDISIADAKISFTVLKFPLKDDAGNSLLCGVYRDNSSYKLMREALRSSENRFNFVLAATQDSIYDWDLITDRIWRNEQYERIFNGPFGPHPDWWKEHIHEDDFLRITMALQSVFEKREQLWNQEYRFKTINGEYANVIDRGFVIYNSDSKPTRMIGAITDITERIKFISDLENLLALSKATFESTTDGILVVNLEGKIMDFNEKFVKMWALPNSIIENEDNQPIIDFIKDQLNEPDKYNDKLNELITHPELESFDIIELKDGKTIERYSNPERANEKIIGRVFSYRDITQRIIAEKNEKNRTVKIIERQSEVLKLNNLTLGLLLKDKLKKIVEADAKTMEVERVSIQFFDEGKDSITSENIYILSKSEFESGITLLRKDYPRYFSELDFNNNLDANSAEDDPRTSELSEKYLKTYGITSILNIPIISNGEIVGIINHEHVGPKRKWTYEEEVFASSVSDIIELALESDKRKKTEEELKKLNEVLEEHIKTRTAHLSVTEMQFRTIAESSHDSIILVDKDGKINFWNNASENMFGYSSSEAVGKQITIVIPKQHIDNYKNDFENFLKNKESQLIGKGPVELSALKKDGTEFPIEVSIETSTTNDEIYYTSIIRDITKRKSKDLKLVKQYEESKQTNVFLNSIIENIPNMIFVKDAKDLRYVSVNKATEELMGYKKEDIIGKSDYDLLPKEQADFFTSKDREVLNQGNMIDIPEEAIDTKTGKHWVQTKKIPIKDESGEPIYLLGISNDITEQKKILEDTK